jgi:tungstate transport system ATP-binding protein
MLDTSTVLGEAAEAVAFREAKDSILPVEARGLIFEAGGKRLIDGIDLRLTTGSVTMIMGPNGAGKSVLIRLLHGLLQPTSGKIIWGGKAFDQTVRKRQAMVFQTPVLLRRSVAANIAFALRLNGAASPERCSQVLELAGLTRQADQPARLLSGGECQRLAIARALATEPDVLFLDEPTVSLDPASVLAIEEIIARARDRGVKIIFITHDTGQARRLGDEIVFLHRGKVVERSRGGSFFDAPASSEARDYLAGRIVL